MRQLGRTFAPLLVLLATLHAQTVPLPGGTGALQATNGWTVVAGDAIAAGSRPDDPAPGPARDHLLAELRELQRLGRAGQHVLLHQPAAHGDLRLVHCYAAEGPASRDELLQPERLAQLRTTWETTLRDAGLTPKFLAAEDPGLWPSGSVRLRFQTAAGDAAPQRQRQVHVVPAGQALQYFEVELPAGDDAGAAAVDALLRSFDGAREGRSMLRPMALGGLVGAFFGVAMALWRRNRLRRQLAAAQH